MGNDQIRNIGEDQLIFGLPKHMEAVAGGGNTTYWEIVPGRNACFTCQAMRGKRFAFKPDPVHPNCTCEVRRVDQTRVIASGMLQGHEDTAFESFLAGQKITVTIHNLGPFLAGARIRVDQDEWRATRHLLPGFSESFEFSIFGEPPIYWKVFLASVAADNSTLLYFIRG